MGNDVKARLVGFIKNETAAGFSTAIVKLTAEFGDDLVLRGGPPVAVWTPGERCWCITCEEAHEKVYDANDVAFSRGFIVCTECGNKRCPKATHHDNACTGSNEPGQEGSAYKAFDPTAPRLSLDEWEAAILADLDPPSNNKTTGSAVMLFAPYSRTTNDTVVHHA